MLPEPQTLAELQSEHPMAPPKRGDPRRGEDHEQSPVRNYVRDIILGLNDGIVSVYALVAGLAGAAFTSRSVGVAGIAAAIAGALSMGLGEYLSTKSQAQYFAAEARREREHIRKYPELEKQELREMLAEKGYPEPLVVDLVEHLAKDEERFVGFMMREEFGVGKESERSPFAAMLVIMAAFVVGAVLPVAPYFLVEPGMATKAATVASLGGLALAGAAKGRVSGLNVWRSGAEMAFLGAVAAVVTFLVGRWVGAAV